MSNWSEEDSQVAEVFPLVSSDDVGRIADWAVASLGLVESWRADEKGIVEHAELHWLNGKVSLNISNQDRQGTMGVALRLDSRASVDQVYHRAQQADCKFSRE